MDLFSTDLFFAIPLLEELSQKLNKVEPHLLEHFINRQNEFLQKINCGEITYLGKKVSQVVDTEQLYLLQSHIISIIQKLVPHFHVNTKDFVLFAVIEKNALKSTR